MSMKYSERELGMVVQALDKSKELMDLLFDDDHKVKKIGDAVSFVAGMSIGTTLVMTNYYLKQYIKNHANCKGAVQVKATSENETDSFSSSMESDKATQHICPRCGVVLDEQKHFDPSSQSWVCHECGQQCIGDKLNSDVFGNVVWYCDECGALLNEQEGFTEQEGIWVCRECGYMNDVSEANILDDNDCE